MSVETDKMLMDLARESQTELIISIIKEELKDSEEPMLGTKGGWREYLIARIKEATS
jgi:hypothetical protein